MVMYVRTLGGRYAIGQSERLRARPQPPLAREPARRVVREWAHSAPEAQLRALLLTLGHVIDCHRLGRNDVERLLLQRVDLGLAGVASVPEVTPILLASAPATGSGTSQPASPTAARANVKVALTLSEDVACPGLPLTITAQGSPAGGTYKWTITGAETASEENETIQLIHFGADDRTGNIPEQKATVSVEYTHALGTASASKQVTIHKIDFDVPAESVMPHHPGIAFDDVGPDIGNPSPRDPILRADATVTIKIDASCPRKDDCLRNYRVGWLQDVTYHVKIKEWAGHRETTLLMDKSGEVQARDGHDMDREKRPIEDPFYDHPSPFGRAEEAAQPRAAVEDDDLRDEEDRSARVRPPAPPSGPRPVTATCSVTHEDSPGIGAKWYYLPEVSALPLRKMIFHEKFATWLVVQNLGWYRQHRKTAYVYLRNFTWRADHEVDVDMREEDPEKRCSPLRGRTAVTPDDGTMLVGKGSLAPSFTEKVASKMSRAEPPMYSPGKTPGKRP
jgi:hypothetical protein